jgi:nucleoside 2-deoxyribosyltransferase
MTEKICFIVTAIGESGTPTRERSDKVYKYLIAPVCEELGYKPIRVDHVNAVDNINETIINHLKTAPMVIADMTDHNPNAFYELGFRQALELPLVPIIESGGKIPFDVITTRTVFYDTDVSKIEESKSNLKAKIKSFENFKMPEKDSRELLTLETVNSNMNKKLDKIINYLEKSDYSPRINSFSDSITNSLIKNGLTLNDNSRISQIQIQRLFQEDKK